MPASREFQNMIKMIPPGLNAPEDDVAAVRQKMASMHGHPIQNGTEVSYTNCGSVKAKWLQAAGTSSDRHALFCHGGGFVSCNMDDYLFYGEYISRYFNCRVLIPDYRLAPESRFPAALEDCFSAYVAMLDEGIDPASILVTGDSCGGGLALATMLKARTEGLPLPACYVGTTAWYDLLLRGDSARNPGGPEPFITPGWYRARVEDYLGGANAADPLASPVYADCTGLPPLLLQVGGADITRDSAVDMARAAGMCGVAVELQIWPDMCHGWHGLVSSGIPESLAAWESAGRFVDAHLGKRPSNKRR
ncbi:MAG: alpha/beta hydrolase [Halieaceae bacterium]|nr:alpha/beta hydrolase [Halieaceae bacterium]